VHLGGTRHLGPRARSLNTLACTIPPSVAHWDGTRLGRAARMLHCKTPCYSASLLAKPGRENAAGVLQATDEAGRLPRFFHVASLSDALKKHVVLSRKQLGELPPAGSGERISRELTRRVFGGGPVPMLSAFPEHNTQWPS